MKNLRKLSRNDLKEQKVEMADKVHSLMLVPAIIAVPTNVIGVALTFTLVVLAVREAVVRVVIF